MTRHDRIATGRSNLEAVRRGVTATSGDHFHEELVGDLKLSLADIGETPQSLEAADLEGRIAKGRRLFDALRRNHLHRVEFDESLLELRLSLADIGETPQSLEAADLEGRIANANSNLEWLSMGFMSREEFENDLRYLRLTLADIGQTAASIDALVGTE